MPKVTRRWLLLQSVVPVLLLQVPLPAVLPKRLLKRLLKKKLRNPMMTWVSVCSIRSVVRLDPVYIIHKYPLFLLNVSLLIN